MNWHLKEGGRSTKEAWNGASKEGRRSHFKARYEASGRIEKGCVGKKRVARISCNAKRKMLLIELTKTQSLHPDD